MVGITSFPGTIFALAAPPSTTLTSSSRGRKTDNRGTVCAPGKMQERIVPILEERVSFLEGRLVEQSTTLADIRRSVEHLEERMDQRFTAVDLRFSAIDERFSAVDLRFTALDQRFTELERKIDSHFTWLVGILVTTLAALFVAVFTRT
jgi:uncharacterized coiled-coil protein SlyX